MTLEELEQVMQALGQRPGLSELVVMVREVSEDQTFSTIEFNEFLQMMSKQMMKRKRKMVKRIIRMTKMIKTTTRRLKVSVAAHVK